LSPVHAVRFVALTVAGPDAKDRSSPRQQMQGRGRLSGDRGIAPAGVGPPDSKSYPPQSISGSQMPEDGPWFEVCVDLWCQSGGADVFRLGHRTRIQRVQMIGQPERIRTARD